MNAGVVAEGLTPLGEHGVAFAWVDVRVAFGLVGVEEVGFCYGRMRDRCSGDGDDDLFLDEFASFAERDVVVVHDGGLTAV